jgi:hypothetical protein
MKACLAILAVVTLGAAAPRVSVDLTPVRGDLRKLVGAEEAWYSDHGAYTSNVAALKMTVNDSVSIKFVEFSPNAYAASGTLKGVDGMSCVLMIGSVAAPPKTAKGRAAEAEGGVLCDE